VKGRKATRSFTATDMSPSLLTTTLGDRDPPVVAKRDASSGHEAARSARRGRSQNWSRAQAKGSK